eukprot:CAMPEP_0206420682 /NCGR_PEP_ID=MMETSP0324_2-20121206/1001_1 /ASSEMBLY_ACC=CAM_ASM_000836 /TAXON_ID=2866 /ORGANISM="Crypthecodinium cohnii, Strain Seligo" /LENGTH=383 /DNA_ID=CAMNT_0053884639 /DNA_START=86 /DNA_END=1237 /DNA_ORIENTATION=+
MTPALLLRCSPVASLILAASSCDWAFAATGESTTRPSPEVVNQDDVCRDGDKQECALGLLQQGQMKPHKSPLPEGMAPSMKGFSRSKGGQISEKTIPVPMLTGGKSEALVRVEASSVNPADWKFTPSGTPGMDFAGTLAAVDGPCHGFKEGDQVWGDSSSGAWASVDMVSCDYIGLRPMGISVLEAAAIPHAGLTAQSALEAAGMPWLLKPTVLILGGSGGVGHMAIQIAKAHGAGKVIATCSTANIDFVKSMGADEVIDHTVSKWWQETAPGSVDVIIDNVGQKGTGDHAFKILSHGGKFVSLLGGAAMATAPTAGVSQKWLHSADRSTRALNMLKDLVDAGQLKVHISKTYQVEGVGEILAAIDESKGGHTVGKIALQMSV